MFADVLVSIPGSTYTWAVNGNVIAETTEPSSGLFFVPEVDFDIMSFFVVTITTPNGCEVAVAATPFILNNPVAATKCSGNILRKYDMIIHCYKQPCVCFATFNPICFAFQE